MRATDSYGETHDQVLTFSLPTTILASSVEIPENLPVGQSVAQLSLTGDDAIADVTYEIVSSSSASFSVQSNRLVLRESLDFEEQSLHHVTLSAFDSSGHLTTRHFNFSVVDVNEAPTLISTSSTHIPQDLTSGQVISLLSGSDQDIGDSLSFDLLSVTTAGESVEDLFKIRDDSLVLQTDAINLSDSPYVLSIEVTDLAGESFVQNISLSVIPAISLSTLQIPEGLSPFSPFATLSTTTDLGSDVSYSLVSADPLFDNQLFTIVDDQLYINFYSDHEKRSDYSIHVQSTDSTSSTMERVFDLQVLDLNESPYGLSISTDSFDENIPVGSLIASISAEDPDFDDVLSYALVSGDGDDDNQLFRVSDDQLLINHVPDFEAKSQYNVRLRVADRNLSTVEKSFSLSVLDLNDAPSRIIPSTDFINSTAGPREIVVEFDTVDDDLRDFHRYSLHGDILDNSSFFLFGNKLKLQPEVDLDENSSYQVRVRSSDFDGAVIEQDLEFNVNHPPESIELSSTSLSENLAIGSRVLTLSTSDPDNDDRFDYSFEPGFGAQDNDLFTISGGSLFTKVAADYESDSVLNLRLRSTDQNGLSTVERFFLDVTDVDEPPLPPALSSSTVDENVSAGTVVGEFTSSDPDLDADVTFQLVGLHSSGSDLDDSVVDDSSFFSLEGDQLVIDISPDFESQSSYAFVIQATDATGLSSKSDVLVSVKDLPEQLISSESVALPEHLDTLYLTGIDAIRGFGNNSDNTIFGSIADNVLSGLGGADRLTGLSGSDTYLYERYSDSLLSAHDTITGFVMGVDRIDAPSAVATDLILNTGIAQGLDSDSLRHHLSADRFPANSAAFFTTIHPFTGLRTFLALNDRVAGYSATSDAVIEMSGYVGEFSDLLVI